MSRDGEGDQHAELITELADALEEERISDADIIRVVRAITAFVWIILGANAAVAVFSIVHLLT